jgi:hypothetical protein
MPSAFDFVGPIQDILSPLELEGGIEEAAEFG